MVLDYLDISFFRDRPFLKLNVPQSNWKTCKLSWSCHKILTLSWAMEFTFWIIFFWFVFVSYTCSILTQLSSTHGRGAAWHTYVSSASWRFNGSIFPVGGGISRTSLEAFWTKSITAGCAFRWAALSVANLRLSLSAAGQAQSLKQKARLWDSRIETLGRSSEDRKPARNARALCTVRLKKDSHH